MKADEQMLLQSNEYEYALNVLQSWHRIVLQDLPRDTLESLRRVVPRLQLSPVQVIYLETSARRMLARAIDQSIQDIEQHHIHRTPSEDNPQGELPLPLAQPKSGSEEPKPE